MAGCYAAGADVAAEALRARRDHARAFAELLPRHFALRKQIHLAATPPTVVCRCEDVPQAALAGCDDWTEAKLHTRCGMGACQGRVCGAAAQFLFGWAPPAPRPPLSPARIATLACAGDAAAATRGRLQAGS